MRGLVSVLTFAACLAAPAVASAQEAAGDPWEGFNRDLFAVHQAVDGAVLEPVARGYRAVTPRPVRGGVLNFLRNLRGPVIFANDVLQGEFGRAGTTVARFGVNTTIGIAGIFDPATSMGLERHDEDFGQTLAVWGVPSGPYIFVPLLGPTTVRDGAGRIVDVALDPLTWAEFESANEARVARTVTAGIASRENLIEQIDALEAPGGDIYVAYRSAYEVAREAAIKNGRGDVQDLPEFDDIDENPATETPGGEAPGAGANQQQTGSIQSPDDSAVFSEALAAPTSLSK